MRRAHVDSFAVHLNVRAEYMCTVRAVARMSSHKYVLVVS